MKDKKIVFIILAIILIVFSAIIVFTLLNRKTPEEIFKEDIIHTIENLKKEETEISNIDNFLKDLNLANLQEEGVLKAYNVLKEKTSYNIESIDVNTKKAIINIRTKDIGPYLSQRLISDTWNYQVLEISKTCISQKDFDSQVCKLLAAYIKEKECHYITIPVEVTFEYKDGYIITEEGYRELIKLPIYTEETPAETVRDMYQKFDLLNIQIEQSLDDVFLNDNEDGEQGELLESSEIDTPRDKEYKKDIETETIDGTNEIPVTNEYQSIPDNNVTTRTSMRSSIRLGEVGCYESVNNYENNFILNMKINRVYTEYEAKSLLDKNGEEIDISKNYMVILLDVKLINYQQEEDMVFKYTDFDLINVDKSSSNYFYLKKMPTFSKLKKDKVQSGYIAFECDNPNLVKLAFREFSTNTLWFDIR